MPRRTSRVRASSPADFSYSRFAACRAVAARKRIPCSRFAVRSAALMCNPATHRVAGTATATAGGHHKIGLSGTAVAVKYRAMKTTSLFPCILVVGLLCLGVPLRAANEPKDNTPWKITGQLEEACSCDAACPCWFGSKPTKMTCSGGQVLFIEKGNYGKVKLDGLPSRTCRRARSARP